MLDGQLTRREGGKLGSANMPTATEINLGVSQQTVEPHTGQKLKVADAPLSPRRVHCVARPSIVTPSRGKRACVPNTLPVRFWHSRQWHMEMRTGSPSHVRRSCPQLHDATRLVIAQSLKLAWRVPVDSNVRFGPRADIRKAANRQKAQTASPPVIALSRGFSWPQRAGFQNGASVGRSTRCFSVAPT